MKFTKVEDVPGVERRRYSNLKGDWKEFMAMNVKIAKVDLTQYNYKSVTVAAQVMQKSVNRFGHPIDVVKRKDEVYLVRRDL